MTGLHIFSVELNDSICFPPRRRGDEGTVMLAAPAQFRSAFVVRRASTSTNQKSLSCSACKIDSATLFVNCCSAPSIKMKLLESLRNLMLSALCRTRRGSPITPWKLRLPKKLTIVKFLKWKRNRKRILKWKRNRKRILAWRTRPMLQDRKIYGAWYALLPADDYFRFLRMTPECFDLRLEKVSPLISKRSSSPSQSPDSMRGVDETPLAPQCCDFTLFRWWYRGFDEKPFTQYRVFRATFTKICGKILPGILQRRDAETTNLIQCRVDETPPIFSITHCVREAPPVNFMQYCLDAVRPIIFSPVNFMQYCLDAVRPIIFSDGFDKIFFSAQAKMIVFIASSLWMLIIIVQNLLNKELKSAQTGPP